MKLTELVEELAMRGREVEEPNPVVRFWIDGRWYVPERVFVDYSDESVIVFVAEGRPAQLVPEPEELEHWD